MRLDKYYDTDDRIYCNVKCDFQLDIIEGLMNLGRKYPNHKVEVFEFREDTESMGRIMVFTLVLKNPADQI